MKSSPTSGARTGLCRCTLGRPGMLPNKTSSIDGCSAAVMETESPSQLRPAVNQRMCTSLTAEGRGENLALDANAVPPLCLSFRPSSTCTYSTTKKPAKFDGCWQKVAIRGPSFTAYRHEGAGLVGGKERREVTRRPG